MPPTARPSPEAAIDRTCCSARRCRTASRRTRTNGAVGGRSDTRSRASRDTPTPNTRRARVLRCAALRQPRVTATRPRAPVDKERPAGEAGRQVAGTAAAHDDATTNGSVTTGARGTHRRTRRIRLANRASSHHRDPTRQHRRGTRSGRSDPASRGDDDANRGARAMRRCQSRNSTAVAMSAASAPTATYQYG